MKISFEVSRGDKSKSSGKVNSKSKPPASRRKKLVLLAIYLALLIGLVIYGADARRIYLADKAYVNAEAGFSIKPPKNWKTSKGTNGDIVEFVNPKANNLDKITVSQESTKLSLKEYTSAIEKALPTGLPYYTQYTEYNTKINGQVAHIVDGQAFIKNDWKKTRLMFIEKKNKIYVVAAGITFGDWEGNKQIVGASLSSFQITN